MESLKLKIRAFGICQDIIGDKILELELSSPLDTDHLMKELKSKYPKIADLRSISIALNEDYVQDNLTITANDRIALIPPVAGG